MGVAAAALLQIVLKFSQLFSVLSICFFLSFFAFLSCSLFNKTIHLTHS